MALRESDVVSRLTAELPRLLSGLAIERVASGRTLPGGGPANLLVGVRCGRSYRELLVEVKSVGEPRMAELAIARLGRLQKSRRNSYPVFAAPFVSRRAREICRSSSIGYVDLLGNAYLRYGSVLIDRVSDANPPLERRGLRSLLAPKATRVVRALLLRASDLHRITDLAGTCSMSPAGVYFVVKLLESKGFVRREDHRRIVVSEPRRLLVEWATNWSIQRSRAHRYFSFEKNPEQLIAKISDTAKSLRVEHAFTGMAGASLVAPFTRYEDVWLYVRDGAEGLSKSLDLRPVTSGANVVLLDPYDDGVFLGARELRGVSVVSDVQLFVDLYTNPARGQEQAEQILEKALRFPVIP